MRLAVIPARSGSKGLKDKNIRFLCGKPLMAYTIEAAIESGMFDEIFVSTDSEKYAEIARKYFASVPFLRSPSLASDTASSWDAVRKALEQYEQTGRRFNECALLQPTSPMRSGEDIRNSFDLFYNEKAGSVVSVCEVGHPVQWCFPLSENNSMEIFSESPYRNHRRQDLDTYYRENGAVYIVSAKKIRDCSYDLYKDNCHAYIMPQETSVDIDSMLDFAIVEALISCSE